MREESSLRALVVEDSPLERQFLADILAELGCEVTTCSRGDEAWRLLRELDFDLVLLDWVLPVIDGLELCRRIRGSAAGGSTSVVVVTARSTPEDLETVLEAGADDYISKLAGSVLFRVRLRIAVQQARVRLERHSARERLHLQTRELSVMNELLMRDRLVAARMQRSMLPRTLPHPETVMFAYAFQPCEHLGGDMLNVFPLDERTLGLYLLDVAGHGVEAALLSATLNGILLPREHHSSLTREYTAASGSYRIASPGEVADTLNRQFPLGEENPLMFTLLYALLELGGGTLRYLSAGHGGIARHRPGAEPQWLREPSFPVGAAREPGYAERSLKLEPRERLFFYSDGIPESTDGCNRQFGAEGVLEALGQAKRKHLPLEKTVAAVVAAAQGFRGRAPQEDDISILGLEWRGGG